MKKYWKLMIIVSMLTLTFAFSASAALAQEPNRSQRIERRQAIVALIAKALNLSAEELKAELRSGNSLIDIAEAQGRSHSGTAYRTPRCLRQRTELWPLHQAALSEVTKT